MKKKLDSYLRSHRLRSGFTQREICTLLGYKCPAEISRLEKGKRDPLLSIALAYQVLFDVPPAELFPGIFSRIEEEVLTLAFELYQGLEDNSSKAAQTKRAALYAALERRKNRENSENA
jgi:transcriptional regulator with XRE-family HTH domain